MGDVLARRIVYTVEGGEPAEVKQDLHYSTAGLEQLLMDVYCPAHTRPDVQLPAILFVHGGPISPEIAPKPKDWGAYVSYGELAAASGLVGITFNHRYYGFGDLELAAEDIQSAIRYVRENAGDLNVDPNRLGLWAFSGGGPQLSFALREPPPYLRALAAFYAVLDLRELPTQHAPGLSPELLQRFSPITYLEGDPQ